jgi:ferredoxin
VKVTIDVERCCGFGDCALLAPEIFVMGDAVAAVVLSDVPDSLESAACSAVHACPVAAIAITGTQ